jgi:hypothetical protein
MALCATQGAPGYIGAKLPSKGPQRALRRPLVGFGVAGASAPGSPSPRSRRTPAACRSQSSASSLLRKYSRAQSPSDVIVRLRAPRSRVVPMETRSPISSKPAIASGRPLSSMARTSTTLALAPSLSNPPATSAYLSLSGRAGGSPPWRTRSEGRGSLKRRAPRVLRRSVLHGGGHQSIPVPVAFLRPVGEPEEHGPGQGSPSEEA